MLQNNLNAENNSKQVINKIVIYVDKYFDANHNELAMILAKTKKCLRVES